MPDEYQKPEEKKPYDIYEDICHKLPEFSDYTKSDLEDLADAARQDHINEMEENLDDFTTDGI